jgi:hypothetical protein
MIEDQLLTIIERIASGENSEADIEMLRQELRQKDGRSLLQLGKYNINIGQGGEGIHIGDRTYVEIDDKAIAATISAIQEKVTAFSKQDKTQIDFESYVQELLDKEEYSAWPIHYVPIFAGKLERAVHSQNNLPSTFYSGAVDQELTETESNAQRKNIGTPIDVIDGLRQYASDHVLLVGKPGSGKSTSLNRLLLEIAREALDQPDAKIPVLVKLRRYTSTLEESIRDVFVANKLPLDIADVEKLLIDGRLLLLLDGWNELPTTYQLGVANFCDKYRSSTSIVVSTRELASSIGALRISKELTMLPLTKPVIEKFIYAHLGELGTPFVEQVEDDRFKKLSETPLLLRMLCRLFAQKREVPKNLGTAFRDFAQLYDREIQGDVLVPSKRLWNRLLRYLSFELMRCEKEAELRLSMLREEAEDFLTKCLKDENRTNPRELAESGLQELLSYHLIQPVIQPNLEETIEFRHQLIQEYYAAERLLSLVADFNDEHLQQNYINYLKWTEPIALMLSLMSKESEVLRIIQLASNVDLMLCARLCGDVQLEFQGRAIDFLMKKLDTLCIHEEKKAQLLGVSRSDRAIPYLEKILIRSDREASLVAIRSLEEISSEAAIQSLVRITDSEVRLLKSAALVSLGNLRAEQALGEIKTKLDDPDYTIRFNAVRALSKIGTVETIQSLMEMLSDTNGAVREQVAIALSATPHLFTINTSLLDEIIHALVKEVGNWRGTHYSYSSEYALKTLGRLDLFIIRKLVPKLISIARTHPNETAQVDICLLISRIDSNLALKLLSETVKDKQVSYLAKGMIEQRSRPKVLNNSPKLKMHREVSPVVKEEETIAPKKSEQIDFASFIETITENIVDSDLDIRKGAIWGLGGIFEFKSRHQIKDFFGLDSEAEVEECIEVVEKLLLPCLSDPEGSIWKNAASSLGKICSPTSLPALVQLSREKSHEEIDNAIQAIQNECKFYNLIVQKKRRK